MYESKAFWGLESNPNANTMNTTMNFATGYNLYPLIIIVIVALIMVFIMSSFRGFG